MKIFDTFMFYDEDMILDFRLNYLNKYVDKFVIVESKFTHSGKKKELNFNIKNFSKFENKIIYLVLDHEPLDIDKINSNDDKNTKNSKYILNGMKRDFYQRNYIINGLKDAEDNDLILISDLDEIPNLEHNNIKNIKNKIIIFKQNFYYYRFNLKLGSFNWYGTRACKKCNLKSPQWLRNIKSKKYPIWRIDTLFSNTKASDIFFVDKGGWHFSNMKTPEDLEKKMSTYAHHREYDLNPLGPLKIADRIKKKETIYNLKEDMKTDKFNNPERLITADVQEMPSYLQQNIDKYKEWFVK